ncbi:hypothetical protein NQ314_017056 [Rhamnusium bicolor]|uniref:BESS domain-containing protein n=1 Tax=Rhamnusium bicolor TaxID=1586634 RepID=A0AAV8WUB4_9CUCU|nr:hypothetical protein NQ314_017056 [Rhamnusium bicolor]
MYFDKSSERSKRKTKEIRSTVGDDVIVHAAQTTLRLQGKRDASKILKEITNFPTRAREYSKAIEENGDKASGTTLTPLQALIMFVEADLTRHQYEIIRNTNKAFYPPYYLLLQAKQECYPPKECLRVTSTCAEIADCKKRWRNIRDTYMKQRKPGSTGSAAKGKSKWSLLGHLEFLNKVAYERSTQSNITTEELNENSNNELNENPVEQDENTVSETVISNNNSVNTAVNLISEYGQKRTGSSTPTSCLKKRKDNSGKIIEILQKRSTERENLLKNICGKNIEEEDAVLMFFKSLAMTVKSFPPELMVQAKSRVHHIISELELQSIQQSQSQVSQPHITTNLHDSRPGTSYSQAPSDVGSYYTNFSPGDISLCSDSDLTQL